MALHYPSGGEHPPNLAAVAVHVRQMQLPVVVQFHAPTGILTAIPSVGHPLLPFPGPSWR